MVTDSSADLSEEMAQAIRVPVPPLRFTIQGQTYRNYPDNREMDPALFYDMLRAGELATTAALNPNDFEEELEPYLKDGKDILILAFSSGCPLPSTPPAWPWRNCRKSIPSGRFTP